MEKFFQRVVEVEVFFCEREKQSIRRCRIDKHHHNVRFFVSHLSPSCGVMSPIHAASMRSTSSVGKTSWNGIVEAMLSREKEPKKKKEVMRRKKKTLHKRWVPMPTPLSPWPSSSKRRRPRDRNSSSTMSTK